MIRRITSLLLIAWVLGFVYFAVALPQPLPVTPGSARTDGIIVLTGAEGRIARGLALLRVHAADKMLVSGVDREVRPNEFAAEYTVEPALMACCITLGFDSVDTRSNASEAARWIAANHLRTVRLVTTDWHMRRAAFELGRTLPAGVAISTDAVPSHPSLGALFLEYHKLLARYISRLWGS